MIRPGIYKIYTRRFDAANQEHRLCVARLWIDGTKATYLELHTNFDRIIPEGELTPDLERRFESLRHNGYYEVVHEEDLASGLHPHLMEPVDLGPIEADAKFIMTGDGLANPATVELWDHAVMVNGRRLDDEEARQLLDEVASGRLFLTPLDHEARGS